MSRHTQWPGFLLASALLVLSPALFAAQEPAAASPSWEEVDRLLSEQKLQQAVDQVDVLLGRAHERGDDAELARALITEVQLRTGLHGYETSVRFLRQETWPESPRFHAIVELFYGRSLYNYLQAYGWEIAEREQVTSREVVDLKAWTREQILAEAQEAFFDVWQGRARWGSEPLGDLSPYFESGNYPAHIRGTLRDAVTYIWVELIGNTAFWSPEQSNGIYKLDLDRLLGRASSAAGMPDLASSEVHPLVRIAAILGDLESWHRQQRSPEAAFEARLELIRRLWDAFTGSTTRGTLREELASALDALGEQYAWWSMGEAQLADFVREGDADDGLIEARRIALDGQRAHPDSLGGQRCAALVASIEAPDYSLQSMLSDGPAQRSILVGHKNLSRLYLRAYALDPLQTIERGRDYNVLPAYREAQQIMGSREPTVAWTVELPPTPDYRPHRTFVVPPLDGPGLYLIVASERGDWRAVPENRRAAVDLVLSDLVLTRQLLAPLDQEVTVRSGFSGRALAGVEVFLYRGDWQNGHRRVASAVTDSEGVVRFGPEAAGDRLPSFVVARSGSDVALDPRFFYAYPNVADTPTSGALVYTDRSVYRPRQTLQWKVVAYRGVPAQASLGTLTDSEVTVELRDVNGEVVASTAVRTNRFGSASGTFEIPAGRLLGQWRLQTSLGGGTAVRVEEYKRPTFRVALDAPESELRLNREATLSGEARYNFGLPLVEGKVEYRVRREPVYPRYGWWRLRAPRVAPQIVAAGTATLDETGRFELRFTPEAEEPETGQEPAGQRLTYRYSVEVDVTDPGGETRSASRSFRLGFVSVEATVEGEEGFTLAGQQIALTVARRDLDGSPRPGRGTWQLVRLEQPEEASLPAELPRLYGAADDSAYATAGDALRARWETSVDAAAILRWWNEGETLRRGELEHGNDGSAALTLAALPAGAYRLRYSTTDGYGAVFETARDLLVAREGAQLALPIVLQAERTSLAVGDRARFLLHSGLEDQPLVLEIFQDDQRVERRVLAPADGMRLLEIPIDESFRGGFSVALTGVRDHQLLRAEQHLFVPWDDRELELSYETFRDRLRPGEHETFRVRIAGADGEALARGEAEVLAYMYDKSLELFAPHRPPSVLALYPNRASWRSLSTNLGVQYEVWQQGRRAPDVTTIALQGAHLAFLDNYAIGGMGARMRRVGATRMFAPATAEAPSPLADALVVEERADGALKAENAPVEAKAPEATASEPAPQVELRTDFSETAFWYPHLITDRDGAVTFELTVPDSVTEWDLWVHALTRDLRGGSVQRSVRTVKDLLVRPYLTRFLREGDRAELEVVVNNAGEGPLEGELTFDILDPESERSRLREFGLEPGDAKAHFVVAAGGGTDLVFPVAVPADVGEIAIRATARAGDWSDGELRPLPILPGRFHLTQSRFAALRDAETRTLHFADLEADQDPTRRDEQLVVTLEAQLFYGVLAAVPYLVDYPYECTEQTLNRFLSTGIVSSLFDKYPPVARMAEQLAQRDTRLERFDAADPNRQMLLEETPWLQEARGGANEPDQRLIRVLDPRIAKAEQEEALAKLRKAQTALGAFPWWPGGPPSPYMTLYLLDGFSRALELSVDVPEDTFKDMVQKAWGYLHSHYLDTYVDFIQRGECCWEQVTYLNYILSSYPDASWTGGVFSDDDRRAMLDFSFRHWREHAPRLKAYLALTLHRAGRDDDAHLVFASIMDSARTTRDEGTFWAPEDRAWLWYNDTIESHAFALRALLELQPQDDRRDGLVQWLLLNKKLNHWKSTRATAEVIYALVHYLEQEGTLGTREQATVHVGPRARTFTWDPDTYTGHANQMVIPGSELDPETMATVKVEKESPGLLFASATWHFSTEQLPAEARGSFFTVERSFFKRSLIDGRYQLEPLSEGARLAPGDQIEVQLALTSRHAAEYVQLRDPRAAGFEPETVASGFHWDLGVAWYEEVRDSGTNFFFERLPAGQYTFKYRLRAAVAGTFKAAPATVQSMYAPEFAAYSSGARIEIGS